MPTCTSKAAALSSLNGAWSLGPMKETGFGPAPYDAASTCAAHSNRQ